MRLHSYWQLPLWLFVGGALFGSLPRRTECNGKTRWEPLAAAAFVLPFVIRAGFRGDLSDTPVYREAFLDSPVGFGAVLSPFLTGAKDPAFSALTIFLRTLLGAHDVLYFLLLAAFQMWAVAYVFRRYSRQFWLSMMLFILSTDYISWMFNGIRQFLAVTLIFAAFPLLIRRRYLPLICIILAASTVHASALLMLPVMFLVQGRAWNPAIFLTLALTAAAMRLAAPLTALLAQILQNTHYAEIFSSDLWLSDDGTHLIRVIVYSVPALLSLVGLRHVRAADDPVMNLCVNCSVLTMALYLLASVTSGMYIGRLPIYTTLYGYIALPWLIDRIFETRSAQLVKLLMTALYLAFFYYQMHAVWNLL